MTSSAGGPLSLRIDPKKPKKYFLNVLKKIKKGFRNVIMANLSF